MDSCDRVVRPFTFDPGGLVVMVEPDGICSWWGGAEMVLPESANFRMREPIGALVRLTMMRLVLCAKELRR